MVRIDSYLASVAGRFDDGIEDFLINQVQDIDRLPDTLVDSTTGEEYPVFVSQEGNATFTQDYQSRELSATLTFAKPYISPEIASPGDDWLYFRIEDPLPADFEL